MRFIRIAIPTGMRESVLDVLESEAIDYSVTEEESDRNYAAVVSFPLPTGAVESVLERVRTVGIDEDASIVVLDARSITSRQFDRLQKHYIEDEHEDRIAVEELIASAEELELDRVPYVVLTAVSAIVATAGMLLDSAAVIVGSMVIAPLIGPAMATAVGTVVDDSRLFARGVRMQVVGLLLSIVSAAAFAYFVRTAQLIPPTIEVTTIPAVNERITPGLLSLMIALGAGLAGVISLATGMSATLVGVMIAVALVPPAAAVGIGLAWGLPMISFSAGVLLLVNVFSINLVALVALWVIGYRPQNWLLLCEAKSEMLRRVSVLLIGLVLLSFLLGGAYISFQETAFEEQANSEVIAVVDQPRYSELTHLETTVDDQPSVTSGAVPQIIVTVESPRGREMPGLAERIDRRVTQTTGRTVAVQVRFINADQTS